LVGSTFTTGIYVVSQVAGTGPRSVKQAEYKNQGVKSERRKNGQDEGKKKEKWGMQIGYLSNLDGGVFPV
jgi:hypothetical protein